MFVVKCVCVCVFTCSMPHASFGSAVYESFSSACVWCGICRQRWIIPNSKTPRMYITVVLSARALSFGALMFIVHTDAVGQCACVLLRGCALAQAACAGTCRPVAAAACHLWLQTVPLRLTGTGAPVRAAEACRLKESLCFRNCCWLRREQRVISLIVPFSVLSFYCSMQVWAWSPLFSRPGRSSGTATFVIWSHLTAQTLRCL